MRLKKLLIVAALAASMVWGQTPAPDSNAQQPGTEGYVAKVIHVKTLTGDSFDRLTNMLRIFKVGITGDANLRTVVVYGPKDVVAQIEKVVAELDTPGSEAAIGRNIEMTLTLLRCSTKEASGAKLPADIEPVAKQLRLATQYKDIQVWDVIPLRLQEGKDAREDMQLPTGTEHAAMLNINLHPETVTRKTQGWSVRFSRLNFGLRIPVQTGNNPLSFQDVGLQTAGDFLEGQKTVLGKVSGPDSDGAIFFVISLKVLE